MNLKKIKERLWTDLKGKKGEMMQLYYTFKKKNV